MNIKHNLLYAPAGDAMSAGGETASASPTTNTDMENVWTDHVSDSANQNTEAPATTPAVSPTTTVASANSNAQTQQPAGQTPPVAQTAATQQALSPEQIADIAAQAAVRVNQSSAQSGKTTAQEQAQPAMSQEQFNKTFNVVQLDQAGFTEIMGYTPDSPKQVEALNNFAQGVVRQALTMAQVHVQSVTRDLEQRFGSVVNPITAERDAQVGAQLQQEFFQTHPQLKAAEPLVIEIANKVKASGRKFQTREEAFNFVAEETRRLLPQGFQSPTTGINPPQTRSVTRQMTPTSVGGQVSARTGSAAAGPSDAKAIFG